MTYKRYDVFVQIVFNASIVQMEKIHICKKKVEVLQERSI